MKYNITFKIANSAAKGLPARKLLGEGYHSLDIMFSQVVFYLAVMHL